jgi:hypothetical protein
MQSDGPRRFRGLYFAQRCPTYYCVNEGLRGPPLISVLPQQTGHIQYLVPTQKIPKVMICKFTCKEICVALIGDNSNESPAN